MRRGASVRLSRLEVGAEYWLCPKGSRVRARRVRVLKLSPDRRGASVREVDRDPIVICEEYTVLVDRYEWRAAEGGAA